LKLLTSFINFMHVYVYLATESWMEGG